MGRLSPDQRAQALSNSLQLEQWSRDLAVDLRTYDVADRQAYVQRSPGIAIDTSNFDQEFADDVLSHLSAASSLDEQILGTVIKGENWQALRALEPRWREKLDAIFIDPPYNTTSEGVVYKNRYPHASWLSLVADRVRAATTLMKDSAGLIVSIDDEEVFRLQLALANLFGDENFVGTLVVESNPRGRTINAHLATSHDYFLIFAAEETELELFDFELSDEQRALFSEAEEDGKAFRWLPFRRSGGLSTPEERPNSRYPIYYRAADQAFNITAFDGAVAIWPDDSNGRERVWRHTRPSFMKDVSNGLIRAKPGRNGLTIDLKDPIKGGRKAKSVWKNEKYDASTHGTVLLQNWFGDRKKFSYPKSLYTMRDVLTLQLKGLERGVVLDFFGGSGTTAHALMDINETDDGRRRFILVETNDYLDEVVLPRLMKRMFATDWRAGRPIESSILRSPTGVIEYYELETFEDSILNARFASSASPENDDGVPELRLDLQAGVVSGESVAFDRVGKAIATVVKKGTMERRPDLAKTLELMIGMSVSKYLAQTSWLLVLGTLPDDSNAAVVWRSGGVADDVFETEAALLREAIVQFDPAVIFVNGAVPPAIVDLGKPWRFVESVLYKAIDAFAS
jgi:adenine-specific DNA-methyltransferase